MTWGEREEGVLHAPPPLVCRIPLPIRRHFGVPTLAPCGYKRYNSPFKPRIDGDDGVDTIRYESVTFQKKRKVMHWFLPTQAPL